MTFYPGQFFPSAYFTTGYFTISEAPGSKTVYPTRAYSSMLSGLPLVEISNGDDYFKQYRYGKRPVIHAKPEPVVAKVEKIDASIRVRLSKTYLYSGLPKCEVTSHISSEAIATSGRIKSKSGSVSNSVSQSRIASALPAISVAASGNVVFSKVNNPTDAEIAMILLEFF